MKYAATDQLVSGPEVAAFLGILLALTLLIGGAMATFIELRKTKVTVAQEAALRQLVNRYEQLAENSLDTQKRFSADISDLRTRTASIEQILRSVE